MNTRVDALIDTLCSSGEQPARTAHTADVEQVQWLRDASTAEVDQLLERLLRSVREGACRNVILLDRIFLWLVVRERAQRSGLSAAMRRCALTLYDELGADNGSRWMLLQWLAVSRRAADLLPLVERLRHDPPRDAQAAALVLAPLFQTADWEPALVFPALLDALQHRALAAAVLDLANHLVRRGRLTRHPAAGRETALIELLGQLVQRLAQLEEIPPDERADVRQVSAQVEESVALIIALCDALAWIGDRRAVGKLYQALTLRHRRIQAEAAAALARLDEEAGREALVALAAEPVARLRVLVDADSLGLRERIAAEYRTDQAVAEAEIALMLAQPAYFGLPPQRLEHVDSRTQYWPGYPQPVACYLFRYTYELAGAHYSNVAITGPVTHSLRADLNDLAPAEIHAIYAGWHAEHESMFEIEPAHWDAAQRQIAGRLEQQLRDAGLDAIQAVLLGSVDQRWVLVARASRDGLAGLAVADGETVRWYPDRNQRFPLGAWEVYWIYKGSHVLRAFNP